MLAHATQYGLPPCYQGLCSSSAPRHSDLVLHHQHHLFSRHCLLQRSTHKSCRRPLALMGHFLRRLSSIPMLSSMVESSHHHSAFYINSEAFVDVQILLHRPRLRFTVLNTRSTTTSDLAIPIDASDDTFMSIDSTDDNILSFDSFSITPNILKPLTIETFSCSRCNGSYRIYNCGHSQRSL